MKLKLSKCAVVFLLHCNLLGGWLAQETEAKS